MIAIGSDHAGYPLKEEIKNFLNENGIEYKDFGAYNTDASVYAEMAVAPCRAVQQGECDKALLVCGTGIGISIAANKHRGIRAAVCSDCYSAEYSRKHNDANALCLGARVVGTGLALKIVDIFLKVPFEGGRHTQRIAYFEQIENHQSF